MVEIIPAVLPKNFAMLERSLEALSGSASLVQVDVVDGVYAKNTTWPYVDRDTFDAILAGDEGLPHWEEVDFEFDLLVEKAEEVIGEYIQAGGVRFVLHPEKTDVTRALAVVAEHQDSSFPLLTGFGLRPGDETSFELLAKHSFDFVQVMGIARVGFQGEPFAPEALNLIERVRKEYPHLPVQVDGGVTESTIPALVAAGASRLVAGSAIFTAEQPASALADLRARANR